jgi:hypothetical protein
MDRYLTDRNRVISEKDREISEMKRLLSDKTEEITNPTLDMIERPPIKLRRKENKGLQEKIIQPRKQTRKLRQLRRNLRGNYSIQYRQMMARGMSFTYRISN